MERFEIEEAIQAHRDRVAHVEGYIAGMLKAIRCKDEEWELELGIHLTWLEDEQMKLNLLEKLAQEAAK